MASFLIRAVREKRNAARTHSVRAALFLKHDLASIFNRLVSPISTDEDKRRRERILNIILVLSILCFIILGTTMVWNWTTMGDSYEGIHPLAFGSITLLYAALLAISKKGHSRSASFLLIAFEAMVTIYTGWQWGASLPATLLLTALVIVTASVLLGSTTGFVVTGGMIGVLTVLGVHEASILNVPDWRYDEITTTDVISYSAMFLFMSFIGWLSNREIDASLARARSSEKLLEIERNALEKKVSERTAEVVDLSRGVFHDLMSPLSAVTLSIEEMADAREDRSKPNDAGRMKDALEKAVTASKRMGSYMESVRRHIDGGKSRGAGTEIADIDKEIAMARDIMAYKARMANVSIDIGLGQRDSTAFEKHDPITVAANPVRIHQMLLNLISNAIDACVTAETEKTGEKIVRVSASKAKERVLITVTDNGCGIPAELLKTILAKPRSTKPHGTGIGLMTVKTIVEKELGGSIEVRSTEGIGTTFIITIPAIKHEESSGNKTGPRKYRESDTPHP